MTAHMSRADVASLLLCVPEGALALIILSNEICTAKGCNAVAVKSNYHKCPFHGKKWFPCKHAASTGGKELLMALRAVVMALLAFPLLKLQPLRRVGEVGLAGKGKGGMVGSGVIRSQWWWCVAQQVGEREWTE
eukprot:scaffold30468_cov30-Attheya_sp.AAC.1